MTHLAPLFQSCPLSLFFFLHALLIKLACHTLLLENNVDLPPRLQRASLVGGFRKSSQNRQRLLCASPQICTGSPAPLAACRYCRRIRGPQPRRKTTRGPHDGEGRAGDAGSPVSFAPRSCSPQADQPQTPASVIKLLLPDRKSHQH